MIGLIGGGIPSTFYDNVPSVDFENSFGLPMDGGNPFTTNYNVM